MNRIIDPVLRLSGKTTRAILRGILDALNDQGEKRYIVEKDVIGNESYVQSVLAPRTEDVLEALNITDYNLEPLGTNTLCITVEPCGVWIDPKTKEIISYVNKKEEDAIDE